MSLVNVVHAQSQLVTKGECEIFHIPPTQISIESCENQVFYPTSTITGGESTIEWNVSNLSDLYVDLSSLWLNIRMQILRSDGSEPTTRTPAIVEDGVFPVNNLGAALFKYVNVYLNQRLVSSNCLNSYRCMLDTLLHTNPCVQRTVDDCAMYIHDPGENGPLDNQSKSIRARINRTKGGKVFEILVKVNTDITNQSKLLLPGVDLRIVAQHNTDAFRLLTFDTETQKHQIKFLNAALTLRKVKVSHSTFLAHQKELRSRPACYVMRGLESKVRSIAPGSLDTTIENLYNDRVPDRLTVVLVSTESFQGNLKLSPFWFEHFNISSASLTLDGYRKQYTYDWENDLSREAYFSLLSELNEKHVELCYHKYKHNSFIMHWNLSADESNASSYFSPIMKKNVRIELKFAKPLSKAVSVILISETPRILSVDGDLVVRID